MDTLINEQASYVLTRAGLSYIYNTIQQHKPEQVSTWMFLIREVYQFRVCVLELDSGLNLGSATLELFFTQKMTYPSVSSSVVWRMCFIGLF